MNIYQAYIDYSINVVRVEEIERQKSNHNCADDFLSAMCYNN